MSPEPHWSGRIVTPGNGGGAGASSLTDLSDVTGEPGPGKSPVADDTGTPLRDVSIRATLSGEEGVIEERTDDKGAWAVNGMAKGEWHLTFQTPGYVPVAAKVTLAAELARVQPISVVLKKVK